MDDNMVKKAIDNINENLWVLHDKVRSRIISWFITIDDSAYTRGFLEGVEQGRNDKSFLPPDKPGE